MNDPTIHAHQPAAEVAVGWQDGTAWFADPDSDGTAPCEVCSVPLSWQCHPDRDQCGWRRSTEDKTTAGPRGGAR